MTAFLRTLLKPMLFDMACGLIGALFAFAAMFVSALFLGQSPWNLLAGLVGMIIGTTGAHVYYRQPLDKPE